MMNFMFTFVIYIKQVAITEEYNILLFIKVILSKEQKQLIYDTVSNFEAYKRCRKKLGLDDAITYGAGMVLLFHGPSGTGKTMQNHDGQCFG